MRAAIEVIIALAVTPALLGVRHFYRRWKATGRLIADLKAMPAQSEDPPMDPALQALVDAVREHRPLRVYRCGCLPCPEHAAAQERREWERAMHQEMGRDAP